MKTQLLASVVGTLVTLMASELNATPIHLPLTESGRPSNPGGQDLEGLIGSEFGLIAPILTAHGRPAYLTHLGLGEGANSESDRPSRFAYESFDITCDDALWMSFGGEGFGNPGGANLMTVGGGSVGVGDLAADLGVPMAGGPKFDLFFAQRKPVKPTLRVGALAVSAAEVPEPADFAYLFAAGLALTYAWRRKFNTARVA